MRSGAIKVTGLGSIEDDPDQTEHRSVAAEVTEGWEVELADIPNNGSTVAQAIREHKAHATSDGSFKYELGTSATLLRGEDRFERIICVSKVPGRPEEQSAYRSELTGIAASLKTVQVLCKFHRITEGTITIHLDGKQALLNASDDWYLVSTKADFDILKRTRQLIKEIPIQIKWEWVKGHQDDMAGV